MKLSSDEQTTVDTYNKDAGEWASKHSTEGFWKTEMDKFAELLPSGCVLEIGSGGGRDARELIKAGYDYLGTDVSRELIKEARKFNPGVTIKLTSIYDMDFPDNSFDGFWCSATLLHIPKSRMGEALRAIHRVIKPSGIGFISIKQGEGEKMEYEEPGQMEGERKRLFVYYRREEFTEELNKNGYEVVSYDIKPMSQRTTWLIYFVRVRK